MCVHLYIFVRFVIGDVNGRERVHTSAAMRRCGKERALVGKVQTRRLLAHQHAHAMTIPMTFLREAPFFTHFDTVLPLDVGHGTFRPGSVRHGGHRATKGNQCILGAFLLIDNLFEQVHRLKNRGRKLRCKGNLVDPKRF